MTGFTSIWRKTILLIPLVLILLLLGSGCLAPTEGGNTVTVEILEKNMSPGDLGECSYQTVMAVANNGTVEIHDLSIVIEIYDPGAGKIAAQESVPVGTLRPGEKRIATSILQTHCRQDYTLRVYARY
jgi:hypothetical protein